MDITRTLPTGVRAALALWGALAASPALGGGDCCIANGGPGCTDDVCEGLVCAIDPFCCGTQWDGICAGEAQDICGACGGCCQGKAGPGCNDLTCEAAVCAIDPFCCNTSWDSTCAGEAADLCPICAGAAGGCPGVGDCCTPTGLTGCNDTACCEAICAADPFCCDTAWDTTCANAALAGCAVCQSACPGPGDCCSPTGLPGCNDVECCEAICGADPFCCDVQWDGVCANAAIAGCAVCQTGCPGVGECCVATGTPGCNDVECCKQICAVDAFCCDVQWDSICAGAAVNQCSACLTCGNPAAGDCCSAHGSPACSDAECCNAICAADPFCCETEWDGTCADAALAGCAVCQPACPGAGDCCVNTGTPGCNDTECCEAICAADPFCCDTAWDDICAQAAFDTCAVCLVCGHPNAGDCCASHGTPFCNESSCCDLVCSADPFCCETQWDDICAGSAVESCGVCGGCCQAHDGPGCNDATCTDIVCGADPFCCSSSWDGVCAAAANELCSVCDGVKPAFGACCIGIDCTETFENICLLQGGVFSAGVPCAPDTCIPACGTPEAGDCCSSHGTPNCDDTDCCNRVCAADPFCCDTQWDGVCADAAAQICGVCGGCCQGGSGPGCNDDECEAIVCLIDPFCCDTLWDSVCADEASQFCPVCGGTPPSPCGNVNAGSCFQPHATPGCDDERCCTTVCAVDPFCCEEEWDLTCKGEANELCGNCGAPGAGDCCTANGTPGCDDAECCRLICEADPFCCDTEWDQICADAALKSCEACAPDVCPAKGDCCEPHGTPGCEDEACCEAICAADPFCCDVEWDSLCADDALKTCRVCQLACPAEGDCCEAHGTPGCEDQACCEAICAADPFCCDVEWDQICTDAALATCRVCMQVACPADGDCCAAHGTPGCADESCCTLICGIDPFCCDVEWDEICADEAQDKCGICDCPGDLDNDGDTDSIDLNLVLGSFGCGTEDGDPVCEGDVDGDGDTDSVDLNIVLGAFGCGTGG